MNIFDAAQNGNIVRIDQLLREGTDINSRHSQYKSTPLMWAAQFSNSTSSLETVKSLLDRGADINIQSNDGSTALKFASRKSSDTSSLETVKLLLDRGADINIQDKDGWTPLMTASSVSNSTSSLETVKLLLDRGTDINIQDKDGFTALMIASRFSNNGSSLETVELLLNGGSDPFIINNEGKTALDLCPTDECRQIIYKGIWNRLYQTDKRLAVQYSKSGALPQIHKDVWELILLNKRQQQLCQDLSSNKNREVLWYFAEMLNIPLDPNLTKAHLCGLISRYLAYGQYVDEKGKKFVQTRLNKDRRNIMEMAQRFGIDTNRSIGEIMEDLTKLMGQY